MDYYAAIKNCSLRLRDNMGKHSQCVKYLKDTKLSLYDYLQEKWWEGNITKLEQSFGDREIGMLFFPFFILLSADLNISVMR